MNQDPLIVIAGPTASGKSGLALAITQACNGAIVNADSMQVYRELRILTARPTPAEEALVPHRLYGVLPAAERCSAARWLGLARGAVAAIRAEGRLPVVVGGTGLYLDALLSGLSPVPDVPAAVRAAARARFETLGREAFFAELTARDPAGAQRLRPGDTQRALRAWEVFEATGRPLSAWQALPPGADGAPVPGRPLVLLSMPPRQALYAACDARLVRMLAEGALAEVAALLALGLDPALPAMKALGVRELARVVAGTASLDAALAAAQLATRHYAKRQMTWFRNRLPGALVMAEQYSESMAIDWVGRARHFLLTGRPVKD